MTKPDPIMIRIATLPDRILWPNTGAHRRTKEPYVAALRSQAALSTHNGLAGGTWSWDGPIATEIDVFWPSNLRILDWTNIHAALKPAEDGIFDKLNANDRQVQTVTLKQHKLPKGWDGYLLYTIIALEE